MCMIRFRFSTVGRALALAAVLAVAPVRATSYYVDSRGGDDTADGSSSARAWRTLERVNRQEFAAGDRLLLRAGSVWEGAMLRPLGSGTAATPIVIDQYETGERPALRGAGRVPCVLRLENQEGWDISNLEITNHAADAMAQIRGIEVRAHDAGVEHHLHFHNLYIHDVNARSTYTNDGDNNAKSFGGFVTLIEGKMKPTAWDDFLVENCVFADDGPAGLTMFSTWTTGHRANDAATWFPSHGVVVRGCTFERIARNGLVVRACAGPLIEGNLFNECGLAGSGNASFAFHCDDAVFQYNEACRTKYNPGDADAAGFDSDYNCRRTVFQFNYSHDNDYGFILVCCAPGGFNEGTIVRDNISQNDGGVMIRFAGGATGTEIYNNTIFVGRDTGNPRPGEPPHIVLHKAWGNGWSAGTRLSRNLIINLSERAGYEFAKSRGNVYDGNLYYGVHPASEPADAHKLTMDPQVMNPGGASAHNASAAAGVASAFAAYALRPDSPASGYGARASVTGPAATPTTR